MLHNGYIAFLSVMRIGLSGRIKKDQEKMCFQCEMNHLVFDIFLLSFAATTALSK